MSYKNQIAYTYLRCLYSSLPEVPTQAYSACELRVYTVRLISVAVILFSMMSFEEQTFLLLI